jgi:phosphoglycolate phosphatase
LPKIALPELGLPSVTPEFLERTIGKGSDHLIRSILQSVGADASLFDTAYATYQRHYLALNGTHSRVFPGVREGLQGLHEAGWRLACVTNKPLAFARPLLESTGLARWFDAIYGGESFVRRKPDPLPLVEAAKALGSTTGATLMIGDSANDSAAARAAGCRVVLVRYGYNHGEPIEDVDADAWIDRIDELLPVPPLH